jgi:serine/threonine protein kinase
MAEDRTSQQERADAAEEAEGSASVETHLRESENTSRVPDVVPAESATLPAPSFRMPVTPPPAQRNEQAPTVDLPTSDRPRAQSEQPMSLLPGARVDDYEIVRLLGRGAFGHVYLARQLSLDRLVALKISENRGSEGRTMARLEHQHIVQVFSEKVDPELNQRMLCMQLVPGIGLEKLIAQLHAGHRTDSIHSPPEWAGSDVLAIIDNAGSVPTALDPSALHDREALGRMDAVETAAWFGGRLAEALDFAHRHGVLHRDIKPANILVNPYGRPLLADFNISSQPLDSEPGGEELFGGTFAYMSPEHLEAFNPSHPAGHGAVTARSDMYSLALVLQQMMEGHMCFPLPDRKVALLEALQKLADDRRRPRAACRPGPPSARKTLERTISRCLEPNPDDRFTTSAELAEQLDGCRRLRQAERQLPHLPRFLQPIVRRPLGWLIALVVLPQVAGSIVNIAYNTTQIVQTLTDPQQQVFERVMIGYNAMVYPIAVALFVRAVWPVWRCWRSLSGSGPLTDEQVETARQKALHLPQWISALTMLGWFPGGVLFPLAIDFAAPDLDWHVYAHFFVSFTLSGLIALAYSLCGAQFVVLRALYPGMWRNVRAFGATVRRELEPVPARLSSIQFLAVSIPLVAAIVLLGLAGDPSQVVFRGLVIGLIFLGIVGFMVASAAVRELSEVVVAMTSTRHDRMPTVSELAESATISAFR